MSGCMHACLFSCIYVSISISVRTLFNFNYNYKKISITIRKLSTVGPAQYLDGPWGLQMHKTSPWARARARARARGFFRSFLEPPLFIFFFLPPSFLFLFSFYSQS